MNAKLKLAMVVVIAMVGTVTLVAMAGWRTRGPEWWTDGGAIRVEAREAPVREILWKPAEPTLGASGSADEYEPRYSADGMMLVFVRGKPGGTADLWMARRTAAGWSEPEAIASVNTKQDELGPELSADGKRLYFYSDRPGGAGGYDLWAAERAEEGWGEPVNLGEGVNSKWNEYGPALSPDGSVVWFSSNRPAIGEPATSDETWSATVREHRTRRDYDLFRARIRDGTAGAAEAATWLNTEADEGAPAMSPAGDFLYFASDRTGGLGGFDMYRARVAGEVGPENLGAAVNSAANDLDPALTADGFRLCFSSDRAKEGAESGGGLARYALWFTVSREVYRHAEPGAKLNVLGFLPWLGLLLLTLVPLLLLAKLMSSEVWRKRLGRLGLVARCLLVSLVIHACLASLFSIWKVGSGIIDLVQGGGGGGNRIVIASGTPGGSAAGQIRGISTGGGAVVPELAAQAPALMMSEREFERVAVPVAVMAERSEAMRGEVASAPERAAAARTVDAPRAEIADGATVPQTAKREAVSEERASGVNVGAMAPEVAAAPGAGVSTGRVEIAPVASGERAGPVSEPAVVDRSETQRGGAVRVAQGVEVAGAPAPDARVPEAAARAGGGAEHEATGPSVRELAGSGPVAGVAAVSGASAAGGSVEIPLAAKSGGSGDGAGVVPEPAGVSSAGRGERVARVGAEVIAPGGVVDTAPAVPGVRVGEAGTQAELAGGRGVLDGVLEGAGGAPTAAPVGGRAGASGLVMIEPSAVVGEKPDSSPGAGLGLGDVASSGERRGLLGAGVLPEVSGGGGVETEFDARLPVVSAPVETFDQRAPESRRELVEKMGGSAETEKAVGLALEWFAKHQAADGSWSAQRFDDGCGECGGGAEVKADAAMTGMVLLCYLGAGHTHMDEGPYRERIGRALAWLVARQGADGDLRGGETMYGQTVGTVALCEALAMTQDPALVKPAQRAVAFVLERAAGGGKRGSEKDTSVLGWLVFTIESARRAGMEVPKATFDAAGKWLEYVTVEGKPGRYAYAKGGAASAAMTAEAMFVQQILGRKREERMMEESARFIRGGLPKWGEGAPTYSWYYATLALFQHQGEAWRVWNEALVRELLANQANEGKMAGSWAPTDEWSRLGGRVYQTAACTLSLEVYYRYRAEGVKGE